MNRPALFDPARWRDAIWSITSVFESGRPQGNPAAYQNRDKGIVSYGRHQATLAAGSLGEVLTRFCQASDSATSRALRDEYLDRVAARDESLRDDTRFRDLLIQAANEPEMEAAQDAVFEGRYYQPAIQRARALSVETPLGLAVLYDTGIQGGVDIVRERVAGRLGGKVGETGPDGRPIDEASWLGVFLDEREAWLRELADRFEQRGDAANARALRVSTFRVDALRRLLQAGNLALAGRFTVRDQPVEGIPAETTPSTSGRDRRSGQDIGQPPADPTPAPPRRVRVRNKIGFHCGPGGNRSGLNTADWGGWMASLTDAGIPLFLKSADDYGPLFEGAEHIRASGVPHTLVYRMSTAGQNDGFSYDVPAYDKSPEEAARLHWERTRDRLPPEFDQEHVWIEPINEVDRNRADWLGRFAVHIAELADAEGYKVTLFGWSSGEPEPEDWETPGMLAYLRLCAERPNQAAVALHEYSYLKGDIRDGFPFKLGRFRFLFDVCDRHGIARPTIHITEWGWEYQNVPGPNEAIDDIRWANELYGPHDQVKGAAIWHLGKGGQFGDIANQAQRIIRPLAQLTLDTEFEVEVPGGIAPRPGDRTVEPVEPVEEPGDGQPAIDPTPGDDGRVADEERVRGESNMRYVADANFADFTEVEAGSRFTKRWRVENTGQTAWGPDFQLVHVPDDVPASVQMGTQSAFSLSEVTAETPVEPGQVVELAVPMSAPSTPGDEAVFSDWRLHDAGGEPFGDFIYVKIVVTEPSERRRFFESDSLWLADLNFPDGKAVEAGTPFTKRWRVKNTGRRNWGRGFSLVFVSGSDMPMTGDLSQPLPAAEPGEEVDVAVDLIAPLQPRREPYVNVWRMEDDRGVPFGDRLWLEIVVTPPQRPLPMTPLSQNDPRWKNLPFGDGTHAIGHFGCLLTTFAMIASAYGHEHTPVTLAGLIDRPGGPQFMPGSVTPFRVLQDLFADVKYDGRVTHRQEIKESDPFNIRLDSDIISRIDAALAQGGMVIAQVDSTPATPYNHNVDQHWVLLIARQGNDYLGVDAANGNVISLLSVYGRRNHRVADDVALRDAILSALFYRSTEQGSITPIVDDDDRQVSLLETGVNVNPDTPRSNPFQSDELVGLDWARFVFKVDAQLDPRRRNLESAFAQFDPIIEAYGQKGISSLIVLNQETVWGNAPWHNGDWHSYAEALAQTARTIAGHYSHMGQRVAYEIWNEGDLPNNPASVFVPPEKFAIVLDTVATAVRGASPSSKLVFGGLASGPGNEIPYLQRCLSALGGQWPVDAIGIHPYGRWATRAPFDWGQHFGTLGQAFAAYKSAFPGMPFWITEMGVAADGRIGPEHYATIADYIKDVYSYVAERHAAQIPVLIWFAWSDWMRNAGIVDHDGRRKAHVYAAFEAVRDRRLPGL